MYIFMICTNINIYTTYLIKKITLLLINYKKTIFINIEGNKFS